MLYNDFNGRAVLPDGTGVTTLHAAGVKGYLHQLIIVKALTGTLTIVGLNDTAGAPKNWVLPAGTAAGSYVIGHRFTNGLTMQKSSAADDGLILVATDSTI